MGILDGKVAVITGATRGLGLAIARAYGHAGAAVVISSRSADTVAETVATLTAEGIRASGLACDVADLAQAQALARHAVDRFGRLDIWVNNAGTAGVSGPTAHIPAEEFVRVVQTNILGVFHGSWVALHYLVPQGHGKLINLLGMGDRRPAPFQNAYGSSKAWVRAFTLALAQEYKDSGVGIFALQPGLMYTDLMGQVRAVEGYADRLGVVKTIMRMWANQPDVPAQRALWLASSATDGRTGLEARVLSMGRMLGGALRELGRRLLRRPGPPVELNVTTVPSVLPLPAEKRG
jgi:NAD(P)-dependent dehydrogenase (short-subunit alcohol dehydrogenase family)